MTRAEEEAASTQFLRALLENTTKEGADAAEVEYMVERLVPVLVPGVVHLLKAVTAIRLREAEGEEDVDQVNPLNHLAKYLLRHNPRFGEPEEDTAHLQALARKMLRK